MSQSASSIIFDFDGVLADTYDMVSEIYDTILVEFGIDRSKFPSYRELFEADYTITLAKLGIISAEDIKQCVNIYYREAGKKKIKLFKDTVHVINALSKTHKLAIVSNTSKSLIENILNEHQLSKHFDYVNGNEAGLKPNKKPYLLCLKSLNVSPHEAFFISDMNEDLTGARAVGLRTVGVTWGFHPKEKLRHADVLIDSLTEITKL
jgi:phosphoglycolate phosphatase